MSDRPGVAESGAVATPQQTALSDCVSIEVFGSDEVDGPARTSFERAIQRFAGDVLQESSRQEAAWRGDTSDTVQYTSTHVETAVDIVRRRGVPPPQKSKWYAVARVAAPTLFAGAGAALSFSASWIGWAFVGTVCGMTAIFISLMIEFKGKDAR